jgi:dCTP deaminase
MAQSLMAQDIATTRGGEGRAMPNLVTGDRLREAVTQGTFIQGGDIDGVEGVKYDFHMGSRILKASYKQAVDINELPALERSALSVEPGEVVFVLTKERLELPANMIAVLSPKRKVAHGGIIVLGGFALDPKYSGILWFGLYNYSSTSFPLQPGKKLIGAMFYELQGDEVQDFPTPESVGSDDFPDDLIALIKNYRPIALGSVAESVDDLRRRFDALTTELRDDRTWRQDFKDALERQTREIDKLLEGLKEEKVAREREDERLRGRLDRMSGLFTGYRIVWAIIIFFVGVSLTAAVEYFIPKLLGGH